MADHPTLTLLITFFSFLSVETDSCTGRWWSTEQCWDHWREWSLYWLKTLEANGEKTLIITQGQMHLLGCCDARAVPITLTHHLPLSTSPRPLWLSPAQVMVIPVGGNSESYSKQVSPEWYITRTSLLSFYIFFSFLSFCFLMWQAQRRYNLKGSAFSVKVVRQFREAGFMVDLNDDQGATLNKKIRSAQLAQYNYIFGKMNNRIKSLPTYYT